MKGAEGEEYRERLVSDRDAQNCLASYTPQIEAWAERLRSTLVASKSDPLEHWSKALDAKRCLGTTTVPITDRYGNQRTYTASLSAAQARVCFLEAQADAQALALGKGVSMFDTSVVTEALARCGEVKYGGVDAMGGLAKCVGGMVRNVSAAGVEPSPLPSASPASPEQLSPAGGAHARHSRAGLTRAVPPCLS
jgi:hypothetical protein